MKRVLITVPDFEIGGFVTHTCNLAKALRGKGYHVSVLAFEPFGSSLSDMRHASDEVHLLWRGMETANRFLRRVVAKIAGLAPDVLINNSVGFAQAALPFINSGIIRMSVVHNVVESEQRLALVHPDSLDWIVAVADNVAVELRELAPDFQRIRTIPVGVEMAAQPANDPRFPGTPLRLVYLGRLAPQKNLPALLRVLSQLHADGLPFQMTIIGSGPEQSWLRYEIARLPFAGQIAMKGPISHRQVLTELASHDVLLMTSRYEGTPHVVLEAMSCGLVVVCSNLPGSTDRIITRGVDGFLCDPANPASYASAIKELLGQPERFGNVSEKARQTIQTQYSAETIGNLYHECIMDARPRPLRASQVPLDSPIRIDSSLKPYCAGFFKYASHRAKDLAKQILRGRSPVRVESKG